MSPINPFMRHINLIGRCSNKFRDEKLKDTGILGVYCPCLLYVYAHPGCTQDSIAREAYLNKSNIARQLATMEKLGYIERRSSEEDNRALCVYTTKKANELIERIFGLFTEWNDYITEGFTDEEKKQFETYLCRASTRSREYIDSMKKD